MPLTAEELRTQIENVTTLLAHPINTLLLCPESIDLYFELRNGQLHPGRVSQLSFTNTAMAEVLE